MDAPPDAARWWDTRERRVRLAAHYTLLGWTARQIADELSVSRRAVFAYRREAGVRGAGRCSAADSTELAETVAALYASGRSAREVGEVLGLSEPSVRRVMAAHGLPARSLSEAKRVLDTRRLSASGTVDTTVDP